MVKPPGEGALGSGPQMGPGWRIALFAFLLVFFGTGGVLVLGLLPAATGQWGGIVALTVASLLASWVMLERVEGRSLGAMGLPLQPQAPRESLVGLGIGGVLIGAAVLLLLVSRSARFAPDSGTAGEYATFLAWTLLFFSIAAAFEEIVFRGYPFQVLVVWIGAWPAILLASLLFAALHGSNPNFNWIAFANIFLAGILLSLAYLRTRSLWFATGVHVGWNWSMASVFDFPVSGLGFETPLYTAVPVGDDWWTGGAFGPEAGLVGTIVLLGGSAWLLRTRAIGVSPHIEALRPIVDDRLHPGGSL
jgi:uncharacterized protein